MYALDTNQFAMGIGIFLIERNLYFPLAHNRVIKLGNLVALRQIGVEIVFAVETRIFVDLGVDGEAGANGLTHTFLVQHWQHSGHSGINQADLRIGLSAKLSRSTGEKLRVRGDLRVHFKADYDLPLTRCTLDTIC